MLLGMVPDADRSLGAEPVLHLDRHPATQWRLSARGDWRAFTRAWGGEWYLRWDERRGTPRFVGAPGVAAEQAEALVSDLARIAGVEGLEFAGETLRGDRAWLRWTRRWQGAPVLGDEVLVGVTQGRIGAVWLRLTPIRGLGAPAPGEEVLVLGDEVALGHIEREPTRVRMVARGGRVMAEWDPRRFGSVSVSHLERTVGDAEVVDPARGVAVSDGTSTQVTDDAGSHGLSGSIEATLLGPELQVTDNHAEVRVSGEDPLTLDGGDNVDAAAAMVLHHFHVVWDWLGARWPEHAWLAERVPADVNQEGTCNAYYTSGTVNFYNEGEYCNNFGQIADVIYHEVGHGIHEYILAGGSFASDVSEGSSDYVAATILDSATLAPSAYVDGSAIREIDTDKVYPVDVIGEPHNDGLIWASFLWNLRAQWGAEATDLLFLATLEQGPGLTDLYEAVLTADDDNGDWSDGTPNDCELIELLDHHGLGPGQLGYFGVELAGVESAGSLDESYPVEMTLHEYGFGCETVELPTATVWYSTDADAPLPKSEEAIARWSTVAMSEGEPWSAALPRVPANSELRWFVVLASADGTQTVASHDDTLTSLESFWVGDREELSCDDLEGGGAGWTHGGGTPAEPDAAQVDDFAFGGVGSSAWDPEAAWSGDSLLASGADGEYTGSNQSYALSPLLELAEPGLMRLLSYRRMLSVEDGRYDQASIAAGLPEAGLTVLWQNASTTAGTTALIDEDWRLHDLSLAEVLEEDGSGSLQLAWMLAADQGLEYSGWNVDEVCVVQLADPEDHYRRVDLVATAGAAVELSWTTPWIQPLAAVLVVRKSGGLPESIDDGLIVALDLSPTPGEAWTLTDEEVNAGESYGYAVFAYGRDDGDAYATAVEGQNAALLTVDGGGDSGGPDSGGDSDADTGGVADSAAETPEEKEEEGGCGCGSTGPAGWAGLVAIGLVWRRRR